MKKLMAWIPALLLAFGILLSGFFSVPVKADDAIEIRTYEELLKMAENPGGSYRLMSDIDLKGLPWTPFDFSGSLDGNGHAILNVTITNPGGTPHASFDGNMVSYETWYAGFFSSLINAYVGNLKILGLEMYLGSEAPTFLGGIAGYMENSTISGCRIYGRETLYSSGHAIGVGGIAGFGFGVIENTSADMTLICVDTDREYKDEQFMGGAYAAGCIDLSGNTIKINGFDSDHGYVHNGGLVGMYLLYTGDEGHAGFINGNTVEGQITFFEDNEDRRAYCEAYIGEIMSWNFAPDEAFNPGGFARNEVFAYEQDLLPHADPNPQYEAVVTDPTETENGYTTYRCTNDGYTFLADFTPVLGTEEAETETEEDPDYNVEGATVPLPESLKKGKPSGFLIAMIVLAVLIIATLIILLQQKKNLKKRRLRDQKIAEKRRLQKNQNPYAEQRRPAPNADRRPEPERNKRRKTPPKGRNRR